jgi:hypothetical protein
LPTIGVSSAVRRAFNNALHPRDGHGRFRDSGNAQRPRPSRGGGEQKPKETVGEKALKTKGVTGEDTIQVLSSRVRKYKGFTTVESFVSTHPKGRAYALRMLAADQKAGRIGFVATDAAAAPAALSAPQKDVAPEAPKITARDSTNPAFLPAEGTPEREFHNGMLQAASVFGDRAKLDVSYENGKPYHFKVDVLNEAGDEEVGIIERMVGQDIKGDKYIDHSIFMLDDKLQGAGQAKKFLASSVEAYKHLGIDKVKVHANIDVGGYAWLKYGFKPDRNGVAALTEHATGRIDALHKAGVIDDTTKAHLTRSVNFEDFTSMIDIGGNRKVEFEGKSQSIGKHLFLNSDWTGELDLHSRTSMQAFNSYVGGQ